LLAATGVTQVRVGRAPTVGLLATGSELRAPGEPLGPGQIYESNRLALAAGMLKKNRSVKTVCFQLGFKRVSHFSREFKSHYGIPPTQFLRWSDLQGRAAFETVESPR